MLLGIDWGKKKIGLALSDKKNKIAFPFKTLKNKSQTSTLEKIKEICEKNSVERVILGLPQSFDGEEHETAKKVRSFGQKLKKTLNIDLKYENEIFTSKIAQAKSNQNIDKRAASIILQSYIDKKNKQS